jgi:hypothetical protein
MMAATAILCEKRLKIGFIFSLLLGTDENIKVRGRVARRITHAKRAVVCVLIEKEEERKN